MTSEMRLRNQSVGNTRLRILRCVFLVLLQWPLAALLLGAAGEILTRTDLIGLVAVFSGAALWLLGSRGGWLSWLLPFGLWLVIGGSFLGLRAAPLLVFVSVSLVLSAISIPVQLTGRWEWLRGLVLLTGTLFLLWLTAELVFMGLESRRSAGNGAKAIRGGTLQGQIEMPDREALAQLLPTGYAKARKVRQDGTQAFDVEYRIDQWGSRAVPNRPDSGPSWVLFGGSFAFGEGLEDDETLAYHLQSHDSGKQVFAFGFRSGGAADALIHLKRKIASGLEPELAIYFFIDDHFRRTALPPWTVAAQPTRPRFVLRDGEPILLGRADETLPSRLARIWVNLMGRSRILQRVAGTWVPDDTAIELVVGIARAMQKQVRSGSGSFLFVILPQLKPGFPEQVDVLAARLREDGIWVADIRQDFSEHLDRTGEPLESYYFADLHPRQEYTALVAKWIIEMVRDHGE